MLRFMVVLAVLPCVAMADRLTVISGPQIEVALNGRALVYESGATQDFRPSGATLYTAGRDSWGYWAVREDQYCSQWRPGDQWDCYDVAYDGVTVRFIAPDGSFTDGTYSD